MHIVFLDTNSIESTSFDDLFGNQTDLSALQEVAKIVIPKIVVDELISHKHRHFLKKRRELQTNPLRGHFRINQNTLDSLEFSAYEKKLRADRSIQFSICHPDDIEKCFDELCALALANEAPFDKGTDKGFKDAVIALSIRDYIDREGSIPDYHLITKDGRLQDYFSNHKTIHIHETIKEAYRHITQSENLGSEEDSKAKRLATNSNSIEEIPATVKPLSSDERKEFENSVKELCESPSFAGTHSAVQQLEKYSPYISNKEAQQLLQAALSNDQISWILSDDDVQRFFLPIINRFGNLLSDLDYASIADKAGIPNNRLDNMGNVVFSRYEREIYLDFVEDLFSHIQSRGFFSRIKIDKKTFVPRIRSIISSASLDPTTATWKDLIAEFIDGDFDSSSSQLNLGKIARFLDYFESCPDKKQDMILSTLKTRLESVVITYEGDIPF